MKSARWMLILLFAVFVVLTSPDRSFACGVTPVITGPPLRVSVSGSSVTFGSAPISLFSITTTHDCVCGIGIGMTGATGPPSLMLTSAVFRDSNGNVIPQFGFALDPITTVGLANGPVLMPGARWFGFHAVVQPFTLPPDGLAFLEFTGTVDPNDINALLGLTAQVASGVGNGSNPVFDVTDPHHVTYSKHDLQVVPEPTAMLLLAMGLAGVAAHLRSRQNG